MNKKIVWLGKFILALAVIYFLISSIGLKDLLDAVKNVNIILLLVAALVLLTYYVVGAWNLQAFMHSIDKKISFSKALKYYFMSWAWGMFIPGKIGDFSLMYYLKKEKNSYEEGFVVSLLIKISSLIVLGILSIIGAHIYLTNYLAWLITIIIIAYSLVIGIVLFTKKPYILFAKFISLFSKKFGEKFLSARKVLNKSVSRKSWFIIGNFYALLRWVVESFVNYLIIIGFGVNISFITVLLINSITVLISMIPITVSGLGIRESSKTYLYTQVGVLASAAAGAAIVYTLLLYVYAFIIMLVGKVETKGDLLK